MSRPPFPPLISPDLVAMEAERAAVRELHLRARRHVLDAKNPTARRLAHLAWAFLRGRRFREVEPLHRLQVVAVGKTTENIVGPDMAWRIYVMTIGGMPCQIMEHELPGEVGLTTVLCDLYQVRRAALWEVHRLLRATGRQVSTFDHRLTADDLACDLAHEVTTWLEEPAAEAARATFLARAETTWIEQAKAPRPADDRSPEPPVEQILLFDRAVVTVDDGDGGVTITVPITESEAAEVRSGARTTFSLSARPFSLSARLVPKIGTTG